MVMEMCLVGFLFSFLVKFFSPNEPKTGNNKITFSMFLVETKNLMLGKVKTRWQGI